MAKSKPISNFINSFRNTELSRPCNFDVEIRPSSYFLEALNKFNYGAQDISALLANKNLDTALNSSYIGSLMQKKISEKGAEYFKFKCEATALPGRTFSLIEQKTYGPVQRHPVANYYNDIQLSIICSDNMYEKIFFDAWMECMSISSISQLSTGVTGGQLQKVNLGVGVRFDFAYKEDYSSVIKLTQYDLTGEPVYEMNLIEAFPFAIDSMPLHWRSMDNYHRVNVSFTYKYYETNQSLTKFLTS